MPNIYATAVNYKGRAVLLTGPSASGKSDLALRLIVRHGARLIADDRTDIRAVFAELEGVSLPKVRLWAFESSAADKIVIKMDSLLD